MSDAVAIEGPVLVVGTGLIGTSIALALRRAGVEVALEDASASALQEAVYRGAGTVFADQQPTLVIVAVPPDAASGALAEPLVQTLAAFPRHRPHRLTRSPTSTRSTLDTSPITPGEPDIDDILAKISRAGLDSLTEDERQRLEDARRTKLRGDA